MELLKTNGVVITDVGVTITKHADGSLLFSDSWVPGVKLKDILGGEVVIDPSVVVQTEESDWTYDSEEELYGIDVPHNFGLVGSQKAQMLVVLMDLNYETIMVNSIKSKENSVFITATEPLDMYVTMKRI